MQEKQSKDFLQKQQAESLKTSIQNLFEDLQ